MQITVEVYCAASSERKSEGCPPLEWGHIKKMGKEISPWDFSALLAALQPHSNIQRSWSRGCKVDIQKTVPSVDGNVCPHQSLSHISNGGKPKQKESKTSTWLNQTPAGARRLMKAMLLRHIFLKKAGQAGFMIKCSRRIRSSVNKVLRWKQICLVINWRVRSSFGFISEKICYEINKFRTFFSSTAEHFIMTDDSILKPFCKQCNRPTVSELPQIYLPYFYSNVSLP